MKVVAIIQARMGSTRLPGKVMLKIQGRTVLEHVISRAKQSIEIDDIVIATTTRQEDEAIVVESQKLGVKYFRGSEEDVLSRYYYAAKENDADIVVRITSDCPLIDPKIIDVMINQFLSKDNDMLSNGGLTQEQRTFPRGLDVTIFRLDVLEEAFHNAKNKYEREHVTPYIYENKQVAYFKNNKNLSCHRWTLDTSEDFLLIREIYYNLYKGEHDFYMKDVLGLLESQPKLIKINQHIKQKKLK